MEVSIYKNDDDSIKVQDTIISGSNNSDDILIYDYDSNNVTINGNAGNDDISVQHAKNSFFDGGDGDDNISIGEYSTIIGGKGDDYLSIGYNGTVVYALGDGNDTVLLGNNNKIKLTDGQVDSYSIEDMAVILKIGDGSMKLLDARGRGIVIEDASGNVTTQTYGSLPDIINSEKYQSVQGTNGNDEILIKEGYSTINAGAGDDTIFYGYSCYVIGGGGDDLIKCSGTINAGTGDDTIYSNGRSIFEYSIGDGNDVILDYYSTSWGSSLADTIKLIDGAVTDSTVDGSAIFSRSMRTSLPFSAIILIGN